jgi:molybdopterin/thiamine biosynthesis adenylyltransferase
MSRVTLVLPQWIAGDIDAAARQEVESAGVLLVGAARTDEQLRLIGREIIWVPPEFYERQTYNSLRISSQGFVPALGRAEELDATPVFFHIHPGEDGDPHPSEWDNFVDADLVEPFRIRSGSDVYASIIFSRAENLFRFTGRGRDGDHDLQVERIVISGDRTALISSEDTTRRRVSALFDRQVRALGGAVQNALSSLIVGVVGSGGTGSAVAEQLVRLGVRDLILIDPDVLTESNVTRVYGSTLDQVGQPKVKVLTDYLQQIAPDADISAMEALVMEQAVARALTGCDVLFGCTDDNAGRLILSRLASYYLMPFIDCGVLISSEYGIIRGIDGRVTVQTPGAACLVCRNRVDLARAAAEQLDPAERQLRQDEGYAPELGGIEPAVVTFTSMVASQAVSELIERLTGYGPEPVPTEVLFRAHDREMSTNLHEPHRGHYCDPSAGMLGRGDGEPFLGQLWSAT